jgi:hypothetical protein
MMTSASEYHSLRTVQHAVGVFLSKSKIQPRGLFVAGKKRKAAHFAFILK